MTELWTPVDSIHDVQVARFEYDNMLRCGSHIMEDGDFCKLCRAPGFAIRCRGAFEDQLRKAVVEG